MNIKELVIEELKALLKENIRNANMIVKTAEELEVTNEQFFLDWEDELNRISIKDHSKASC